jgi:hypothetical protein
MPPSWGGFSMDKFNIFSQLASELKDFFEGKIKIASPGENKTKKGGYEFNQFDTLQTIEYYTNDKFESGDTDSEGQQKLFLNICSFRAEVAAKQIDLDVKNFVWIPEEGESVWPAYFCNQEFKGWAKDNYFGELLNDTVERFPKYGTVVLKRVGKVLEPVPLINLRNQQDAKSLQTATYVIEEHKDMTKSEMEAMPDWKVEDLDLEWDEKVTVYERYGRVPLSFYKKYRGEEAKEGDDKKSVDCLAILTLKAPQKGNEYGGTILFLEQISRRPYEEVHYARQDGRWLGIGEVEKNFGNQVARNMIFNLRRRALMWSAKKIFQSADDTVAKNLVKEVRDGEVLQISPNGQISEVITANRNLAEFKSTEDVLEENSNQRSFTFEVATGEALPSGTPFRLGVVLANSVNSYYGLKQEKLGLFFKRVINELVWPVFKKDKRKEHIVTLFDSEKGIEALKQVMITLFLNEAIKKSMLAGVLPEMESLKAQVTDSVMKIKNIFAKLPEGYYDEIKAKAVLDITGETIDFTKKIETLTNLYNTMSQRGDPRADSVLKTLVALTGETIDLYETPPQPQGMGQMTQAMKPQGEMDKMVAQATNANAQMTV